MRLHAMRSRAAGAIAVIGTLCAVAAIAVTPATAATWTGSAHGKILRSSRLVSGGTSWHGTFWFRTDRHGTVRGQAVVGYEPSVDVSGLNNAIAYVKSVANAGLGILGPFGTAAAGAGLGQIVGTSVSFHEPMAIRRGRLSGELHGRRLALHWDARLRGIPYDILFQLASATKQIGRGTAALRSPFDGAAQLVYRSHAVASSESRSQSGDVTQLVGSYWVAHRTR